MKEDIDFPEVKQVGVCAIPEESDGVTHWKVHVINLLNDSITNVLVSTKGYGLQEDEKVKTSELRHYFEEIPAESERPVEVIPEDLVGLNNQYWLSFYIGHKVFDKKFIFLPDTLLPENLTHIPVLDKPGILII